MLKRILVICSVLFYIIACCIIAFKSIAEEGTGHLGITCLAFGWISFASNFAAFVSWLANFPYLINIVMVFAGRKTSFRIISVILALMSLFLSFGAFGVTEVMKDESRTMEQVTFGPGFFLWFLSILIMLVASILPFEKKKVEINYIQNPNPQQ